VGLQKRERESEGAAAAEDANGATPGTADGEQKKKKVGAAARFRLPRPPGACDCALAVWVAVDVRLVAFDGFDSSRHAEFGSVLSRFCMHASLPAAGPVRVR